MRQLPAAVLGPCAGRTEAGLRGGSGQGRWSGRRWGRDRRVAVKVQVKAVDDLLV